MGLTRSATGHSAAVTTLHIRRTQPTDRVFALAGNPNVGKSTVFNALTGLNQHTGNWPGKTVTVTQGHFTRGDRGAVLVDVPGTYSLLAQSADEYVACDFLCFGAIDGAVVVCDATAPERSLNLVLQIMEVVPHVIVCINLMDEAQKKGIQIDCASLSAALGVPVVAASARSGEGIDALADQMLHEDLPPVDGAPTPYRVAYPSFVEDALDVLHPRVAHAAERPVAARWTALRLLCGDGEAFTHISENASISAQNQAELQQLAAQLRSHFPINAQTPHALQTCITTTQVHASEQIAAHCVTYHDPDALARDRRLDRIFMGRWTGIPILLLLLLGLFWLTIFGANYFSDALQTVLFAMGTGLEHLLHTLTVPNAVCDAVVYGIWRVLAWVVSVMLPPMAIFFPLFTLLEDVGYLPRVAFLLDRCFCRAGTCGRQALTMCMGFGCNAAGVIGCRIISSPRERLIAVLTNSLVPCNGRFPILITLLMLFFGAWGSTLGTAVLLTACILGAGAVTLLLSALLSRTVLRGTPSTFALELPPYRRPQIGQVLVRSMLDRTLFVLGRAAAVAAPAGLLIWLLANIRWSGISLLQLCAQNLDPIAYWFGLDGVILLAFLLGFPANETVIPIMIMAYSNLGTLQTLASDALFPLFTANGWTPLTAVCVIVFTLFHWPCSTTCWTVQKETGKLRWTLLAVILPTLCGALLCFGIALVGRLCF